MNEISDAEMVVRIGAGFVAGMVTALIGVKMWVEKKYRDGWRSVKAGEGIIKRGRS